MKRLAWLIVILAVPIIVYFQYKKHKRFNPPTLYSYPTNDSIDVQYFDPSIVLQYYKNVYTIESVSRQLWYEKGIDIRFPDLTIEGSRSELDYYTSLWATTKILEKQLINSTRLKSQGLNNIDIRRIVVEGVMPSTINLDRWRMLENLKQGNEGQPVWELQKLLIDKGYELPFDGVFGLETYDQLIEFQKSKGLIPSGIVDIKTITKLVQ